MESPTVANPPQAVVVSPVDEFREPTGYAAGGLNVESDTARKAPRGAVSEETTAAVDGFTDDQAAEPLEELDAGVAEPDEFVAAALDDRATLELAAEADAEATAANSATATGESIEPVPVPSIETELKFTVPGTHPLGAPALEGASTAGGKHPSMTFKIGSSKLPLVDVAQPTPASSADAVSAKAISEATTTERRATKPKRSLIPLVITPRRAANVGPTERHQQPKESIVATKPARARNLYRP